MAKLQFIFALVLLLAFADTSYAFEVIAHRGIYQTYSREDLDTYTCTADRILPPAHEYIENTTASIKRAFELGADIVELDVHPTTETAHLENRLVVFHDWELLCRTNATCTTGCNCNKAQCITDEQSWSYLQSLDIGFNYTADGGTTFPFRGKGLKMPTLMEAISLLKEFPGKKILINVKDHYYRTQTLLLKELGSFPQEVRTRVYVEFQPSFAEKFKALAVPEAIWQGSGSKKCFKHMILFGWSGYFPASCRNLKFFVPLHQDLGVEYSFLKGIKLVDLIPGWPDKFIKKAKLHNSQVYLSQVNSEKDLEFARSHPFAGIMTDRIEIIGPRLKKTTEQ